MRGCDRAWTIATACLVVVAASCGDDTTHGTLPADTADAVEDARDTASPDDTDEDTAHADTTPADTVDTGDIAHDVVIPDGAVLVDGIVTPPGGGSPVGWRILNRFGVVTVTDPDGAFVVPIAADGVTVTVGAPPGASAGDTTLLVTLSTRVPELDPETPPPLRLDAVHTAAALVAAHPALADADPARARGVLAAAAGHRAVTTLAARLTSAWPAGGRLLEEGDVRRGYADAVTLIARALTPAWPDTSRVASPRDDGDLRVRPLDDSPAGGAALTGAGDLRLEVPADVPLAAVVSVATVDVGGDHARVRRDGGETALELVDEADVLALRDGGGDAVHLATTPSVLRRAAAPAGHVSLAAAVAAATGLDDEPIPLAAEGLWLARMTTGAVGGREAVHAWRDTPADAWGALRANLLSEALRLARWVAPDAAPGCFAGPLAADDAGRDGLRADVLAGSPGPGLAALLAELLATVTPSCAPPADPAAPWIAPLVATALVVAPEPVAAGLTPSPASPVAALRHGRGGYATGRLLLLRGAPLAPRLESVAAVPAADTAAHPPRIAPGAWVTVAGTGIERGRVELVDGAGRLRTALIEEDDAGARGFDLPPGLAGVVEVRPAGAASRGAPAWLEVAPRIDRIDPDFVYRGGGPQTVRVEGAGLAPGQPLHVGLETTVVPDDAQPDHFELTLDPAALVPGSTPIAIGPAGGDEGTAGALFVADTPVVLDALPSPVYPGQTLRLGCLRVGLDPDDVAVSLEVGGVTAPAPVRTIAPDGAGRVLVTATAPSFSGAGFGVARVTTPSGTGALTVALAQPPTRIERQIGFHATNPAIREVRALEAFSVANGEQPEGEFWRVDSGWSDAGQPWCPLDVRPAMFAVPASTCAHPSGICDDGWAWSDMSDPSSWIDVTEPPGRLATGACPTTPGLASWESLAANQVLDRVTTSDLLDLDDAPTLMGPGVHLSLRNATGGGLTVAGPAGGGRNDVTLDLDVSQATGAVVTLDGVTGVRVAHLKIVGAPGLCDVGLRVVDSEDVRIADLDVTGCAIGVRVEDSRDVRTTAPVTLFGNGTGVIVARSTDIALTAHVGYRAIAAAPGYGVATGQTDGVVVEDSDRVLLDVPTAVALSGDAVRAARTRDLRVSARAGFVTRPDGSMVAPSTAVDVGVRLADGVERARVTDTVVMNARDGVVLGAVSDVLVARAELGVRAAVGADETLPPGNRGAGIRVAPFAGVDGVLLRDVVVARNAEAGVRVEIAEGDLRLEGITSEVARDGGALVPSAQPCLLSAVYTAGLRGRGLVSRGDANGACLVGCEDVVIDGLAVAGATAEGVYVSQSSDVLLRDLVVDAAAGDGVRFQAIGSAALEEAVITDPGGDGVRLTGTLSAAGYLDVTRATVLRPRGNGVDSRATGGLCRLQAVEVFDPTLSGIAVTDGAVRIDDALVTASDGVAPAVHATGLEMTGKAQVDAEGLVIEGLAVAGVDASGSGRLRLGPATRIRDNGGAGIALDGALHVELDGARVYDNAGGALRVEGLDPGARLVARDVALEGGAPAVRVERCGGSDGLVELTGGALGSLELEGCDHPVRIDGVGFDGDVALDRVAVARITRAALQGSLLLAGDGDHRLDGVQLFGGELRLSEMGARGVRLSDMAVVPIATDAVTAAHLAHARVDGVEAGPEGATVSVAGAPPHAWIDVRWRADDGATTLAGVRAGADGTALARGLATPGGQGEWWASATLPDGAAGGDVLDDACRTPDTAPAGTAPEIAWLDGQGGIGRTTLALPGALGASTCGAIAAWSAAPGGQGGDIWILDVASGDVAPLTNGGADDREPTLAPSCDQIAWVAAGGDGVDLMIADVAVGAPTAVTSDVAVERSPLLTPSALYYARRAPGDQDFVLVRRDRADLTASAEVVYDGPGDDLWPAASADGAWLAWTRCPAGEAAPCGLAILGPGGGATALVGVDGRCDDRRPAFWSDASGAIALAAVRRPVAADDTLGASRLVTLTRFGRATWGLTDGATPIAAPFVVHAP